MIAQNEDGVLRGATNVGYANLLSNLRSLDINSSLTEARLRCHRIVNNPRDIGVLARTCFAPHFELFQGLLRGGCGLSEVIVIYFYFSDQMPCKFSDGAGA